MARKAVAQGIQAEVLAGCRRRCAICFGLNRDMGIKLGQIAHIDRDAANPLFDNLVFLCLEHHDQFDSRTSQSKGLTPDEVRRYRRELATAIEQGAFGYFGAGAHIGGEYDLPAPSRTAERITPELAPLRLTIREGSAAEILGNLKGVTPSYRFREKVEELYLERWTREPGWRAAMYQLPSKLPGVRWHCSLKEVDSGTLLFASTVQDLSALRIGDLVTVSGRISDVSQLGSVSLEDAVVRHDSVSSLENLGLPR